MAVNLGGGNFKINNKMKITNGTLDINSGGGDIEITGDISGNTGGNEVLELDDGTGTSGTITLGGNVGAAAGSASLLKSVTLVGDTAVKLVGTSQLPVLPVQSLSQVQ